MSMIFWPRLVLNGFWSSFEMRRLPPRPTVRAAKSQFLASLAEEAELFHTLQGEGYARIKTSMGIAKPG